MSNRIVKQAGLLQAEIDRLRAALMAWENREGSCCPEGVPFERVIEKLRAELKTAQDIVSRLREMLANPPPDVQELVIRKLNLVSGDALEAARKELTGLKAELGLSYDPNKETALAGLQRLSAQLFEVKRENAQLAASLVRIVRFPIHSEPTGGAYAMQDIARAALSNVCPECGGTGGVDSGGSTPWGAPINLPCPSCEATRKENSIALRELLLPAIDLLQLAISRACWPHEEIVHKELSRLRSLCGEEAQV